MDIRERARKFLNKVPPIPQQITSNGTPKQFHELTGMTQEELETNWNAGGIKTSCNSFVATYAGDAGIGIARENRSLGQFGLDKKLKAWDKSYAWIPATEGARPKYGDIFELAGRLHQGVSLDFEGDVWNTAEGGQGGKSTGYDIVMRKRSKQEGNVLVHDKGGPRGVMKAGSTSSCSPTDRGRPRRRPCRTGCSVPWRGQVFYYFFDTGFKVSWTLAKPITTAFVPMNFNDTASVTFDGPESMTLNGARPVPWKNLRARAAARRWQDAGTTRTRSSPPSCSEGAADRRQRTAGRLTLIARRL